MGEKNTAPAAPTHAYLAIHDGCCQAVVADLGDLGTADCLHETVSMGGHVERVTLDVARRALFEPWPPAPTGQSAAAPQMLAALRRLGAIRPDNWNDGDDAEAEAAWRALDAAIAAAEGR